MVGIRNHPKQKFHFIPVTPSGIYMYNKQIRTYFLLFANIHWAYFIQVIQSD